MTDREFETLIRAQEAEINRELPELGECHIACRETDGGRVLSILRPVPAGRAHHTFVVTGRDEDGDIEHRWAHELAAELFMLFVTQFSHWDKPTRGAVSPALSEFFAFCHPEPPAMVTWARWLRIQHETDEGAFAIDAEMAAILVEEMIEQSGISAAEADLMRRAVAGEPIGERDPDQPDLF